jgi:hypothetical protein
MEQISTQQPDWVCHDCGQLWGRWYEDGEYFGPSTHCATYHNSRCGVCTRVVPVTEPRDYGFLRRGWQKNLSAK